VTPNYLTFKKLINYVICVGPDSVIPTNANCRIPEGGIYAQCPGDGPAPNRPNPQKRHSDDWNTPGGRRRGLGDSSIIVHSTA
jgi:hypothetical protein